MKEKWLVLSKMAWGIWQTFTRALESLEIGTFIGSFYPKCKIHELKIHRGVVLWQWRLMQNLKRNWLFNSKLTKGIWWIFSRALKNLKNLHFNELLLTKVYIVSAEKIERSCLMALKIDAKFEGKLTCAFKIDIKNLANFRSHTEK